MNNTRQRTLELMAMGYQCSQIVMIMGLESRGLYNPTLVRAIAGLAWGCGESSCTCGCLTGACCLLSILMEQNGGLYEQQKRRVYLSTELVRWFWEKYGFPLGGIDCMAIREADSLGTAPERCQQIIETVYEKVQEITIINKLDVKWGDCYAN
jgi:hypothetical protein